MDEVRDLNKQSRVRIRGASGFLRIILVVGFSTASVLLTTGLTIQTPRRFSNPPSGPSIDFWNLTRAFEEPLNIEFKGIVHRVEDNYSVSIRWLEYTSEHYGCWNVRINGFIAQPVNQTKPLPAILMLHGTNGSSRDFLSIAVYIASKGYIVMGIDAPGCGESSREPACKASNIVNISGGPGGAYYYHAAWSAIRAVTFLTSIEDVDKERIAVAGASMGGVETYIVAAVDPRVKAAIPIVASGNYRDLIMSGSLANHMVPKTFNIKSELADLMIKYFDVYFYASKIDKPILVLVSTNDEFFTLHSINDTFTAIPYRDKVMNLAPNWTHSKAYPSWITTAILWLNGVFKDGPSISSPKVDYRIKLWTVEVESESIEGYSLSIVWRSSIPGSLWIRKTMKFMGNRWIAEIEPVIPCKVFFYVALESNGVQLSTSPVYEVGLNPPYLPVLLIATVVCSSLIYRQQIKRISTKVFLGRAIAGVGWVLTFLGFLSPHIVIIGRTELTMWDLLERYGLLVGLNPWMTVVTLIVLVFQLSTVFIKPRLCWITALINCLIVLAIFNLAKNSVFKAFDVAMGYGMYILIASLIAHLIYAYSNLLVKNLEQVSE
ncbi:MAG: alpha/beta fold hydrolase [Candidatus Bathyarchaeia archaeon]